MKTIPNSSGTELQWKRLENTPTAEFELHSGVDLVARLRWVKKGGSMAVGESASSRFSFKRVGFFAPQVSVRKENSEFDVALFTPNWKGDGKVTLSGGQTYIWKSTSFWKANYTIADETGSTILSITHQGGASASLADIVVGARAVDAATLALLSVMAMYVGLLAIRDGEESSMVAMLVACS